MTALLPPILAAALLLGGLLRLRRVRRVLHAAFLAPTAEQEEALIASLPRLELRAYFLLMQVLDRLRGLAGRNPAEARMLAERERRLQARLEARRRQAHHATPPVTRGPPLSRADPGDRDRPPPAG